MSSTLSLLVPMNVTALCVGKGDQSSGSKFGKIALDFQNLETKPYLGSSVVPKPFAEEPALPGIHLHWALPDALTRSDPSDGNGFPQAPNRFLVVRLAVIMQNPAQLERKAWVVESDYLWKDEEKGAREQDARNTLSRAVPVEYLGDRNTALEQSNVFAFQGRVHSLDTWKDSKSTNQQRFTALGYGTEAYAAAYPHCRNVFGFFDPLFDPGKARDGLDPKHQYLSYLVVGWYSDIGWDPTTLMQNSKTFKKKLNDKVKDPNKMAGGVNIADLTKEAFSDAFKADYRWSYNWSRNSDPPGVVTNRPPRTSQPAQTLFVGQLTALEWKPSQTYLTPNTDLVAVALGTTTAEALSALLASTEGPENASTVESLLNDIQYDLLRDYATAAGQANLQDALHQRDFTPVPAGHASATSSSLFVESDFTNVDSLLDKLQNDSNKSTRPVSQFVWQQIPRLLQQPLADRSMTSRQKQSLLVQAFNMILKGASIYEPARFKHVTLRPETQLLIPQKPTGERLIRLNRLLLVDTYPLEIGAAESGSGRIWLIKRTDSGKLAPGANDLSDAARAIDFTLPEELGNALNQLNLFQAIYDDLAAGVATRRGQLFADWTKYLASKNDEAKNYIEKEIEALNRLVQEFKAKETARDRAKGDLKDLLRLPKYVRPAQSGSAPPVYEYELDSVTAPRYYQPNDPVILLSGVDPSTRYGGDGRLDPEKKGNLICRLSDEITTPGELTNLAQEKRYLLNTFCARADWDGIFPPALPYRDDLISLCVEACLLNHWMAKLTGSADLVQYQSNYITRGETGDFKGVAPSRIGFTEYAQPWIPLILQWETAFSSFQPLRGPNQIQASYPETWGLQNFELSQSNPEIAYTGTNPGFLGPGATTYQGTATLMHNVELNLIAQIDRYLKDHPPVPEEDLQPVQKMKRALGEISQRQIKMMAQSMEGFHRQLLMRDQSLQMRVVAPPPPRIRQDQALKQKYLEAFAFGGKVSNAVLGECDASCLEDRSQYNPLRAGILKITRLRVLDAFGQIRDIIHPNQPSGAIPPGDVILSARLKKAPKEWNETAAVLPLRIAQPARLSFRYRSASFTASDLHGAPDSATSPEMNGDPASSPIFGWVLYNRFDHALAIYDEEGLPVGSFNLLGPPWQETPGPKRSVVNPHLVEFLQHLGGQVPENREDPNYSKFRAFLSKLIDTIDHVAAGIEPDGYKQDQGLVMLIGRPLALVIADLRLDLYGTMPGEESLPGHPAIDQSREAFDAVKSAPSYVEKDRRSADFAKVRFPVLLGDDGKVQDGLVGYFVKDQDASATYRTFYAPSAASGESPDVLTPPVTGTERLSLAPADKFPKTVVMLVDPRAAVHASTGILPVKSITLPPAYYADALKRIDATFLVAPVLGGANGVALPVPSLAGHAWSWLTRQADERFGVAVRKWATQDLVVSPNSRAAFSSPPLRISEGWLHLYPVESSSDSAQKKALAAPTPHDILVKPGISGDLTLAPETARLHGARITMAETDDGKRFIGYWDDLEDYVTWRTKLTAGAWNFQLHKRKDGINDADEVDSQIEIEVRKPESANVVASSRTAFPRGRDRIHAVGFATELPGEYEIRVKLLQGAINLERIDLGSTQVVKQNVLTLSAKTAALFQSGAAAISKVLGEDGQYYIRYRPTPGALTGFAYWTATFADVQSGDIGVEISYSTQDADSHIVIEARNLTEEQVASEIGYTCAATGGLTAFQTLRSSWPKPTVRIPKPGIYQIRVRPRDPAKGKEINVRWVKLVVPLSLALN